ncbi:MAG: hypothetical protein JW912_07870, partial [Sedimentisphaerales bacterium]|nr:hypothetical protein [Sedimentisphaerales bacterium]
MQLVICGCRAAAGNIIKIFYGENDKKKKKFIGRKRDGRPLIIVNKRDKSSAMTATQVKEK